MRAKAHGNAENHIITQAGVASIASSWLSSLPVAPDAGWKPAYPGNPGRMPQDSGAKSIQIGRRSALCAFPPQQNNAEQSE